MFYQEYYPWSDIQDTFECEELNQTRLSDWGDSILYAANRNPDALEEATRKAIEIKEGM